MPLRIDSVLLFVSTCSLVVWFWGFIYYPAKHILYIEAARCIHHENKSIIEVCVYCFHV